MEFKRYDRVRCNARTMPQPHGWEGEEGTVEKVMLDGCLLVRMDIGEDRRLPFREEELDLLVPSDEQGCA